MIQFSAALGLIVAGLFVLWTQGLPLLNAMRTGVLVSRAFGAPKIDRRVEPERFDRLMRERRGVLAVPTILIIVGLLLIVQGAWVWLALEQEVNGPQPYLDGR